jgi:DNA-binding beta-propeller fold protein YncE
LFDIYTRKELARVDLAREKGVGAPAAKAGPEGIAFDPIADLAYVTLHGTNQVVAIDLRGYKVLGFGATGTGPDGIGYSPLVRR